MRSAQDPKFRREARLAAFAVIMGNECLGAAIDDCLHEIVRNVMSCDMDEVVDLETFRRTKNQARVPVPFLSCVFVGIRAHARRPNRPFEVGATSS